MPAAKKELPAPILPRPPATAPSRCRSWFDVLFWRLLLTNVLAVAMDGASSVAIKKRLAMLGAEPVPIEHGRTNASYRDGGVAAGF